jgi:hypothetical protein
MRFFGRERGMRPDMGHFKRLVLSPGCSHASLVGLLTLDLKTLVGLLTRIMFGGFARQCRSIGAVRRQSSNKKSRLQIPAHQKPFHVGLAHPNSLHQYHLLRNLLKETLVH